MHRRVLVGILLVLSLSGCAGVSPVQVGQTAGTIAGGAIAPGVGAPFGALVGLLAGMVVQGKVDQATEQRERKELKEQWVRGPRATAEALSPEGVPTRVWADETVQEGRLITGHFETRSIP